MKKIYTIIAGLILMLLASSVVFAEDTITKVEVGNVEAESGAEVEVPITMSDNVGILGATLTISYDNALTLKDVNKGSALSSLVMTKPGDLEMNPVKILWDGEKDDDSNGVIASLVFTVPKAGGTFPVVVTYEDGDIIDSELNVISLEITNGSVIVQDKRTDQERADEVIAQINKIDANDKSSVEKARQLYNALTDDQKKLIGADILKKLTDAEDNIRIEEDNQSKADEVSQLISEMDTSDKEAVINCQTAYESLTEAQKKLVSAEILKKLTDAEQAIQEAEDQEKQDKEAADAVCELIRRLPDQVKINDEASVAEARNKYNALSEAQKNLISNELLSKLEEAEKQIEEAKAEAQKTEEEKKADEMAAAIASGKIDALPDPVTIAYEQDILEVRESYDKLSEAQKKLVAKEKTDKLTLAETQMEEIKTSMQMIYGTPQEEDEIQKAKVEKEAADKTLAENVEKQLSELPENAKLEDEETVIQARISYEILSSAQKGLVTEEAVTKLEKAEKQIETAKKNNNSGKDNAGTGKVTDQGTSGTSAGGGTQVTKQQTSNSVAYNKAVAAAKKLKVKGLKVKVQKKRKAKISWKVNKKASGYQIQYSTHKKFKKANKVITVKSGKKKKAALKKLKIGKTYYVRIRPYVTVKDASGLNQAVYGKWSKAKRVRIIK